MSQLRGVITEQELEAAEVEFPGIVRFFLESAARPRTFLELVWQYLEARRQSR